MNAKVTVKPGRTGAEEVAMTPSEQVVRVSDEATVTDANGVTICLKKPGVLAQFRLIEMMGDSAKNEMYMAMVTPIIYVTSIGGVVVPPPAKKVQIEALISRLGDEGVNAVFIGVRDHWDAPSPEEDKEALKK